MSILFHSQSEHSLIKWLYMRGELEPLEDHYFGVNSYIVCPTSLPLVDWGGKDNGHGWRYLLQGLIPKSHGQPSLN